MIKSISLLTRKPGMTHEQFIRHWGEIHAPLAKLKNLTEEGIVRIGGVLDQTPADVEHHGPMAVHDGGERRFFAVLEKMPEQIRVGGLSPG